MFTTTTTTTSWMFVIEGMSVGIGMISIFDGQVGVWTADFQSHRE